MIVEIHLFYFQHRIFDLERSENAMQNYTSYECGFDPYGSVNTRYDIRFYLISLLFLLFDIEIVYLLPLIFQLNIYSYSYSLIFLIILVIGLIYEYRYSIISD